MKIFRRLAWIATGLVLFVIVAGACVRLTDAGLRQMGIASPRIAVAALNPHGGDNGLMGNEELVAIGPAVEDLSVAYPDGTEALHGLSLCVAAGERVALIGANGSGKTSLLLAILFLPESLPPEARQIPQQQKRIIDLSAWWRATQGPLGSLFLLTFFSFCGLMVFACIFGLYALERFGYGTQEVGIIFQFFQNIFLYRGSDRHILIKTGLKHKGTSI